LTIPLSLERFAQAERRKLAVELGLEVWRVADEHQFEVSSASRIPTGDDRSTQQQSPQS
jgi:hypothetical protein